MLIESDVIQFIIDRLATFNDEMGGVQNSMAMMQIDIAILKVQMTQVLMYQKIVLGAFLTLTLGIIGFTFRRMFIRIFNNKK